MHIDYNRAINNTVTFGVVYTLVRFILGPALFFVAAWCYITSMDSNIELTRYNDPGTATMWLMLDPEGIAWLEHFNADGATCEFGYKTVKNERAGHCTEGFTLTATEYVEFKFSN